MDFVKKYAYIILGVVCVLALGGLYMGTRNSPSGIIDAGQPIGNPAQTHEPPPDIPEPEATPATPSEPEYVVVHIVGEVHSPGVYEVPYGSRINDVLQLAGGYTDEADLALINLAAFVQDAMQIRIPAIGEEPQISVADGQQGQAQAPAIVDDSVNINLANLTELQTLPGIGPVIAQNIIDFREANGGFNSIEELLNVARIGETTFERIKDRVTIGG